MTLARDAIFALVEARGGDDWDKVKKWTEELKKRGADKFQGSNFDGKQEFWAIDSKKDRLIQSVNIHTMEVTYDVDDYKDSDAPERARRQAKLKR